MSVRRLLLALSLLVVASAAQSQGLYREGEHYHRIDPPVPTQVAPGKVEVVELFSYACVHCATFEPFVTAWKKDKPAQAEFRAIPAVFNAVWEAFARAFYAAEAMQVSQRIHEPLFKAVHQDGRRMATIEQIADFVATLGIDRQVFLNHARSAQTDALVQRAVADARAYGIEGTPSVIVNGKWRIGTAGGFQGMLDVVNYLVSMEAGAAR